MALVALFLVLVAVSPATADGTAASRATLKVVGVDPIAVAGRNFKARERVKITADGRRRAVTAGVRGNFKVVFPEANTCNGFTAVARGSQGSRATVTFAQFSNVHCLEPGAASAGEPSATKP